MSWRDTAIPVVEAPKEGEIKKPSKFKFEMETETYRWNDKTKKWWDYRGNQWKVSRKQRPAPKSIA